MKKSQAATELLLSYGWVFLVILAAVAAIAYFGVFNPKNLLPQLCEFPAGFDCIDRPAIDSSSDQVQLAFKNNLGSKINITAVSTDNTMCAVDSFSQSAPNPIDLYDTFTIIMDCSNDIEGKFEETVTITYINLDTGLMHPAVGIVRG